MLKAMHLTKWGLITILDAQSFHFLMFRAVPVPEVVRLFAWVKETYNCKYVSLIPFKEVLEKIEHE